MVNNPTPSDVRTFATAVTHNVIVRASSVLECISKKCEPIKSTVFVDSVRDGEDGGGEPAGVYGDGAEGVAKNFLD